MEERIAALLGVVHEEIRLYRDLIEHARHKTALLVRGCTDQILELHKVEETYSIQLRILESEISRLCSEICQALRIPRKEFTLLKLAEGAEPSVAEEIRAQTSLFRTLVAQLSSVNRRNMRLAESSLRYSRGMLDLLAGATGSYQGTGKLRALPAIPATISHQA